MAKKEILLFRHCFLSCEGENEKKGAEKVKRLTMDDRRSMEKMWSDGATKVEIAAYLGISMTAVYDELKRGERLDENGDFVLDVNGRPEYSAEKGHATYLRRVRNCGRRPAAKEAGKA